MSIQSVDKTLVQDIAPYLIPAVLLSLGCFTARLIDGPGWKVRHFFVGLDLTIYFLATCLVNILDIAQEKQPPEFAYIVTVGLIVCALLCLFYQTTVHQDWQDEKRRGRRRTFMLCGVSNVIGLVLLYGFMKLKVDGVI